MYNQISNIPSKNLSDSNEYYSFESFIDWAFAQITGDSYSQAISKIVERANWNKGVKCVPILTSQDCFDNAEVKAIINTYGNLVTENGMAEYDRKNNPSAITGIENLVSEKSGKKLGDVKIVLWELYHGTLDGTIKFYGILKPRTYAENANYLEKDEKDKSGLEKWWESLPSATTLSYIVIGALFVGGGLYIYSWLPKNRG